MAARYILEGNWRVGVFGEGMLLTRSGKNYVLSWADITTIKQRTVFAFSFGEVGDGIPFRAYRVYTIRMQGSGKHNFSGVKVEPLGDLILQQWNWHKLHASHHSST